MKINFGYAFICGLGAVFQTRQASVTPTITRTSFRAPRTSSLASRISTLYLSLISLLTYVPFQEYRDIKQTGCVRVLGYGLHAWWQSNYRHQ